MILTYDTIEYSVINCPWKSINDKTLIEATIKYFDNVDVNQLSSIES